MYKIGVYFSDTGKYGSPFNEQIYLDIYSELSEVAKEYNCKFFYVRGADSYLGNASFSNSYQFIESEVIETGAITLDSILDKSSFDSVPLKDITRLNSKRITDLANDKWLTYLEFSDVSPLSFLCKKKVSLISNLKKINTDKVVIKTLNGSGGSGVSITDKNKLNIDSLRYPLIIQGLVDASSGIEGVSNGVHDYRVIYVSHKATTGYLREPSDKNELRANWALGGTGRITKIPEFISDFTDKIIERLEIKPNFLLSVDVAVENGKPYLLELNSKPGLDLNSEGMAAVKTKHLLVQSLINVAIKKKNN